MSWPLKFEIACIKIQISICSSGYFGNFPLSPSDSNVLTLWASNFKEALEMTWGPNFKLLWFSNTYTRNCKVLCTLIKFNVSWYHLIIHDNGNTNRFLWKLIIYCNFFYFSTNVDQVCQTILCVEINAYFFRHVYNLMRASIYCINTCQIPLKMFGYILGQAAFCINSFLGTLEFNPLPQVSLFHGERMGWFFPQKK